MPSTSRAILVIDLAFGDCGKGTVVDYLTRRCGAHTVVRFNGGPQAGHNVVTPGGRHHTFSQFGSGSFVPGVRTLLSRFMLIEPYALFNEAAHLEEVGVDDALAGLLIDGDCPVITPAHQAANRLREIARGDGAHGTCGVGAGEAMADLAANPELMLRARELANRPVVIKKLRALCDLKADQCREVLAPLRNHPRAAQSIGTLTDRSWIEVAADNYVELARRAAIIGSSDVRSALRAPGAVIFEGAQGVLLDETYGFHPHTTWSTTTFANAQTLLDEAGYSNPRTRVGVLRTYFTRHGAGPFVTEDDALRPALPEPHNGDAGWQGRFRVGPFDAVAARYAVAVAGGVDGLAITHLDRLSQLPPRVCTAYRDGAAEGRAHSGDDRDADFVLSGDRVVDIRVPPAPDEVRQARLTARLRECTPAYSDVPDGGGADSFLDVVQRELGASIAITSSGPTHLGKQFLDPRWPK
jgi:adenylosuccinate synthase